MASVRPRKPLVPNIDETKFRTKVIDLATSNGWEFIYFRPLRAIPSGQTGRGGAPLYYMVGDKNAKGWPDLVIGKDGVVIFRELKTETGRLDPEQAKWLALLRSAGLDTKVWRPRHWLEIQAVLTGAATPALPLLNGSDPVEGQGGPNKPAPRRRRAKEPRALVGPGSEENAAVPAEATWLDLRPDW